MTKWKISKARARELARREMGRPIKAIGIDHTRIDEHEVSIFYYMVKYVEIGWHYRADIYVNGVRKAGIILNDR